MSQYVATPTKTFTAGGAIAQHLRVKTPTALAVAGSTDHELGTMENAALASGDPVAVRLRTAQGTCKMVAVDAITSPNPCYAAAGGKIAAAGTLLIGIALETSAADGDIIEVLRRQETSDSAAGGGTTGAAFLVDSDSAIPKIELASAVGGTGDFKVTIKPPATIASSNKVATLPDATGTIVLADAVQTISGKARVTEKHTAGDTLTAAESGSLHSNTGASGTITLVLPAATAGQELSFYVGAAFELRLDPAGAETIALPSTGVQGAAGKYLVADAVGEHVRLICETAGSWLAFPYAGTWSAES